MDKYAVYYDDGEHNYQLEVFSSEDEARKVYLEEVAKFKANPAEYTEQNPNDWDDEFYPDLELTKTTSIAFTQGRTSITQEETNWHYWEHKGLTCTVLF